MSDDQVRRALWVVRFPAYQFIVRPGFDCSSHVRARIIVVFGIALSYTSPHIASVFPSTLLLKVNHNIVDNTTSHIFRRCSM